LWKSGKHQVEGLTMSFAIGELTEADLSRGLLETLSSLSPVELTPAEAVPLFQERLRTGLHTFVARVGDRVAGTITMVMERKFIHRGGLVGHIEDVAVHADYQGQGIGAALVQHATDEARRLGCYKVILNCLDSRVAFYERCGFRRYENGMRLDL
jgi:glucosamine-phosphate N-acetyltransferase